MTDKLDIMLTFLEMAMADRKFWIGGRSYTIKQIRLMIANKDNHVRAVIRDLYKRGVISDNLYRLIEKELNDA